jgi:hypothetical protein
MEVRLIDIFSYLLWEYLDEIGLVDEIKDCGHFYGDDSFDQDIFGTKYQEDNYEEEEEE